MLGDLFFGMEVIFQGYELDAMPSPPNGAT